MSASCFSASLHASASQVGCAQIGSLAAVADLCLLGGSAVGQALETEEKKQGGPKTQELLAQWSR